MECNWCATKIRNIWRYSRNFINLIKIRHWNDYDVTIYKMNRFGDIIVIMVHVRKCILRSYWSTDPLTEVPKFEKTMSHKRWKQFWTFWHFFDKNKIAAYAERWINIRPLLDYVLPNFEDRHKPNHEISVDKCIIHYRGRVLLKTCNPAKIIKYCLHIQAVCESKSG